MTKPLRLYSCGILLMSMSLSHAITLQDIEISLQLYYENAIKHLPKKQKDMLILAQKSWLQYRDFQCGLQQISSNYSKDKCKIFITYRHNVFLKLLRPNQSDMIRFIDQHINDAIDEFKHKTPESSDQDFNVHITKKLNNKYDKLYLSLNFDDQIIFKKSYAAWVSYQNQICSLLNKRNLIAYNYCAAKLSLDIISDMRRYLKDQP